MPAPKLLNMATKRSKTVLLGFTVNSSSRNSIGPAITYLPSPFTFPKYLISSFSLTSNTCLPILTLSWWPGLHHYMCPPTASNPICSYFLSLTSDKVTNILVKANPLHVKNGTILFFLWRTSYISYEELPTLPIYLTLLRLKTLESSLVPPLSSFSYTYTNTKESINGTIFKIYSWSNHFLSSSLL